MTAGGLYVASFRQGPFWNFSYLVACERTREAAVIDPAWDTAAIVRASRERDLTVRAVLLTHAHSDHINGVRKLVDATGGTVFAHAAEAGHLDPHWSGPVELIHPDEALRLGEVEVRALHTPGHSAGSVSFLVGTRLFCGDTLNVGSVGRPGPGRDSAEALWESVRQLRSLSPETVVHPGHDDGPARWATLGGELERVAALRAETFSEFLRELERTTGRVHRHED